MFLPLTFIKTVELLEFVLICLFPIALVTSITLSGILIYAGAFVFLLLYLLKRKENLSLIIKEIPLNIPFLIYIFVFSLTKLINSGMESSIQSFCRCCQDYFLFLWILSFCFKNEKNQKFIKYVILAAAYISVIYGMLQFFHLDIFHRQVNPARLSGFHKNPYSYGGQLIVFFFLFLNEAVNSGKLKSRNLFKLVILIVCFFCVLNTSERAVIIGVCLGMIIYFVFSKVKKEHLLTVGYVVLIPLILTSLFNKSVLFRIRNIIFSPNGNKSRIRFRIWGIALAIWKRNILFGSGKFPQVYYQPGNGLVDQVLTHAHNVYLQILVTNGLFGLLAFLNLFFVILKSLFVNLNKSKYALSLIAVMFAFLAEGFFEYFWGDSEVRYLLVYFIGFVFSSVFTQVARS